MPTIFISGHGDMSTTVQAMKAGTVEFLTKPVSSDELLSFIEQAIERSRAMLDYEEEMRQLGDRFESLTPRERGHAIGCVRPTEQADRRNSGSAKSR